MHKFAIEISTEVFHLLQQRGPAYITLAEEKSSPTQKILLTDDIYNEFIDRAIAHRQTLDQVVREACAKTPSPVVAGSSIDGQIKRLGGVN